MVELFGHPGHFPDLGDAQASATMLAQLPVGIVVDQVGCDGQGEAKHQADHCSSGHASGQRALGHGQDGNRAGDTEPVSNEEWPLGDRLRD